MNREQILSAIKGFAMSQGLYGRMYEFLTSGTDEAEDTLTILEEQNFGDAVDMVMFIEG